MADLPHRRRAALRLAAGAAVDVDLSATPSGDDELPELERLLADKNRRMMEVYDRRDRFQDVTGLHSDRAGISVGDYSCTSESSILHCRDLGRITTEEAEEAIATLQARQARVDAAREEAGLAPYDREFNRLRSEYFDLRERVATAPVRTFEGLAVKLRQLLESAEHGQNGHEGDLARTALEGLERLAAKPPNDPPPAA